MALVKDKIKSYNQKELLANPKVQAMLKTIRHAEGTSGEKGYNTRVGGGLFNDLSKKPKQKVFIKSINDYSSAEGAYQFLDKTWDGVSKKLGLNDFSPQSQDLAAVDLIIQRGAIDNILNDDFEGAVNKLSLEWASLPKKGGGSQYSKQNARSISNLSKVYYNGEESKYPTKENITPNLTTLPIPTINSNFTEVSPLEVKEEEEETDIAKVELTQKQNEEDFFTNYLSFQQEPIKQEDYEPTYEEATQQDPYDVTNMYAQAEQFIGMQQGGIIKDNRGQWAHPGEITEINSPNITMNGVAYNVLGISKETGEQKLMKPNQDYFFDNTENVLEIPQLQKYFK